MQTRKLGRTEIRLSVVGVGTSQLQMLPRKEAVATLVRSFERGVNWVHTAPDYGGLDPWIREAIDRVGRDIIVATSGSPRRKDLEAFFENTCHVYGKQRLELYGIAGIEDIEWNGEDVWGPDGMVSFLQAKKAEGRLGALYCTTHESPDYVARLVESQVFDAIMLSWNPLGFHQQSHAATRSRMGRGHEDLEEFQHRIFPLAQECGVSILVMRPLAGGMLLKSLAFPPRYWSGPDDDPVASSTLLRAALELPGVCSVLPGTASVAEAEENAAVGVDTTPLSDTARRRIRELVASKRANSCSHCGDCEVTCSRHLPLAAMFRDATIWTLGSELNQADPSENYFDLHPETSLACLTCRDQTCLCPQGIDIPAALEPVHNVMQSLLRQGRHPGPSKLFANRVVEGTHRVLVLSADVPRRLRARETGVARFVLRNMGTERWLAMQHDSAHAMGIGLSWNDRLIKLTPLRNTINQDELFPPVSVSLTAPSRPGVYRLRCDLRPLSSKRGDPLSRTIFYEDELVVEPNTSNKKTYHRLMDLLRRLVFREPPTPAPVVPERPVSGPVGEGGSPTYRAELLDQTFPSTCDHGVTYGVRISVANTGSMIWEDNAAHGSPVQVEVLVGDVLVSVLPLPQPVPGDEQVTLHFCFRAPDQAGMHQVRVELNQVGVRRFATWTVEIVVQAVAWSRTVELFELERQRNPWHYNPFQGITQSRDGKPYPLFIERAKGSRVWDTEGNEFIDYTMGWGSTILGHADDRIQQAIRATLDCGAVLPSPHPLEMEVSQMLVEDFSPHEMVAFGKNGSDVCSIAARLARVTTGKHVILSCGFHGWQDFSLEYFQFQDCGIPFRDERSLFKFRFNDVKGFLALYEIHKKDLAAVMIEPAGPLIDDEVGLGGEPD
ncbi:aminotransferase class III-fold pyridoxal phosphate-dependent enzyme, partial [Pseudomonadota bacterium]